MLPANSIVQAAIRWFHLLRVSTLGQASSTIRADASYTDLTQTQYASGLELLRSLEFLSEVRSGTLDLSPEVRELPDEQARQVLFQRILARSEPAWLRDADVLIPDPDEVPQDAESLADTLGLSHDTAYLSIRSLHGKIDQAERSRLGLAGEQELVDLLEQRWPGSTTHVSQISDGFGYDILFRHADISWHLEVKTTTRRGRLIIHLSRHEQEVGLRDPFWRLIVLGLNSSLKIKAIATVRQNELWKRSPRDVSAEGKWESASHEIAVHNLQRGLSFLGTYMTDDQVTHLQDYADNPSEGSLVFGWFPGDQPRNVFPFGS